MHENAQKFESKTRSKNSYGYTYNIGQNKKAQLAPYPLKSNDEGAKEQKRAIFDRWNGGRGGPDVPLISSEIVAVPR